MCRLHAGLSANEKVRKSKKAWGHEERRWLKCFQRAWQREERERERSLIHINKQADTQKETRKKTGHIPQAPENVLVILGRVLLIDERGVFKPLPLWSWFNSDCTWQAAECFGTFVIFRSPIQWYLTTAWHHKVHRRKDERSVSVGVIWIKKKICSNFL